MRLEGTRIIVTGGARGIGEACVRVFVREGARVVSLDVLDAAGQAIAAQAQIAGPGTATFLHCDIAQRSDVDTAFEQALAWLGGLDVLANVAGVERRAPATDITDDEWDLVFDVNVKGTLHTNQAAYRAMQADGGRILNFGSDAGLAPYPNGGHYSASKGAVMSWTRTVAAEWAPHGITVNTVVPAIWTPMYEEYRARLDPEELARHDAGMRASVPLGGRLGDAERDLGPVMVFLASGDSHFITGQIISANGGIGMVR
jgi:NAD(P)-dependent dehydrogenase (short-subunit alcohol dehydrogenase family)